MWRITNAILILLCLFGRPNALPAQEASLDKVAIEEQVNCDDRKGLAFWKNLSHLPIKFININKDSGVMVGQFASPTIFDLRQMEFKLTPQTKDENGLFFQVDKDWGEEINRKAFLKKFKNDFWVVNYVTVNEENIICGAHQFKNWQSLEASYGQGAKNFDIKTREFWSNLKSIPAFVREVAGNNIFWLFVSEIDSALVPQKGELIYLQNGAPVAKYQRFKDGTYVVILGHGSFTIDKSCIFHVVERRDPRSIKIPMIGSPFSLASQRVRVKQIGREYFFKNALHNPWLCFYAKDSQSDNLVVLRVVGLPIDEENGKKNGNGKNQNDKNSKDGKNYKK